MLEEKQTVAAIYETLGISREVYAFGSEIEKTLQERFEEIDQTAEYNQLKVVQAMQECRVSEGCFNYVSDMDTMIREGIRWRKSMHIHSIQKLRLSVRRLLVERMRLH